MDKKIFSGMKPYFYVMLYLSDVSMFILSFILIFMIDFHDFNLIFHMSFFVRFAFFTLLILLMNYISFGLYKDKRNLFDDNEFIKILYSILTTMFLTCIFVMLFSMDRLKLIFLLGGTLITALALTTIGRIILYYFIYFFRKHGYDKRKVFFYGENTHDLIKKLKEKKSLGYDVIGSTNSYQELKKSLKKVDIVFVTKDKVSERMMGLIIQEKNIDWKIIPSAYNLIMNDLVFEEFKDYPIINVKKSDSNYRLLKRVFDVICSGTALLILSPLFLIAAILIKTFMPGPVFFTQERLGVNLKPFRIYKFRSMIIGADEKKEELKNEAEGIFKKKDDPRVTKLGRFLRRTCIDELPQLINIFTGDMSVVGPRPHLKKELIHFKDWRMTRFNVKPGLTGLWQINGRHELNFDKAILYDIYYIKHMSLILDLNIIIRTIPAIIFSKGKF